MSNEEDFDEDEEDEEISEGAEYSPKSEFSKPKIVFEAMQRSIEVRSKEMMKGFWNVKLTNEGMPIRTWSSDTRKVFIGSVIALRNLLSPEILNNKRFKEKVKAIEDKIKEAKEQYCYCEKVITRDKGLFVWKETGKKYIPEIGSKVIVKNIMKNNSAEEVIGGWDDKVNIYWDTILESYDEMFAVLNQLINSLNYFKQRVSY